MKETKELIGEILALINEIKQKSEDGKLTVPELFGLGDNILAIYNESKDIDLIKQ